MNFSIIPIGSVLFSLIFPSSTSVWESHGFRRAFNARMTTEASAPEFRLPMSSPILDIAGQSPLAVPSGNSLKLRDALMARATPHLTPILRNPAISDRGLDPATLTVLQQQQAYRHSITRTITARSATGPFDENPALSCQTALIHSVNGKATGAIFTPQMPNNSFRIEGCLFGDLRGQLDLEPHPLDPALRIPTIPLTIDAVHSSWSNTRIEAHLDSHLSGIPDVPVTLVMHLPEGHRIELPGCFFVAARGDPKLLESIPASWITLQPSTIHSRSIERLEYVSPPVNGSGVPPDAAGASAFVSRLDGEDFGAGADIYDFSQLNPGWVVESVQLQTYVIACPGTSLARHSSGHWDTQWNGRKVTVQLRDDVCSSRVSPSFIFNLSVSQYALKVWVVGPVGTKPLPDALMHSYNRSVTQTK